MATSPRDDASDTHGNSEVLPFTGELNAPSLRHFGDCLDGAVMK